MANLRAMIEADLAETLEGDFSSPVVLIDPEGQTIATNVTGRPLVGLVLLDSVRVNPDTGEEVVVGNPVITLRRSSLERVPMAGETWLVKIPTDPTRPEVTEAFIADPTRPPEGGRSIGFVKLYLRRVEQS